MITNKLVRFAALILTVCLSTATAQSPQAPVRVSSGVSLANRTKLVVPIYPQAAKQVGLEGAVRMDVAIDKEGKVAQITVLSGPTELLESAVTAVSQWEYRPTLLNGQPVDIITQVEINYSLAK